ncbi:MAG TPA: glycoside hydrolase family 15 protein [Candidatus Angelobacter sp.]
MLSTPAVPPKIQDYAVIGDCRTAALISRYGSVDWLCWPRFDSPAIFAALLDRQKGGRWSIAPTLPCRFERRYLEHTNVLEMRFFCGSGEATLTDFMPVASEKFKRSAMVADHELVRQLVCTVGEIEIQVEFQPRAEYGRNPVRLRDHGPLGLRFESGGGVYWLRCNRPLHVEPDSVQSTIVLKRGETLEFSLSYAEESPAVLPALGERVRTSIERSVQWWQQWAARSKYEGPYREMVMRSALALKLLAYAPSGAVLAAATTSLPERVGDSLNWDYRYCWLRDASLTIRALLGLGYMEEAESFLTWLLHATRLTQPELRVMYNVFGGTPPRERELGFLGGYFGSRPVRTGNGARDQLQLDVYGEVIDATAQYANAHGTLDRATQKVLAALGKHLAKHWDLPDEGIWEPRDRRANHTHSRLLCWTALDRLLALCDKGLLSGAPREEFLRERERIRRQIETLAWNEQLRSYASTLNGEQVDATLLRIPWYGFESADSERMKLTYGRVCEEIGAGDGLLYRYKRQPAEGAFGICGFWAVECLALGGGTLRQAHDLFDRLVSYGNDLGLFPEEIDPATGDALGNFPQAFTHVGLISAALTLEEKERGEPHPAEQTGEDARIAGPEARA